MRDNLVGDGRLFQPDIMLPAQYFAVLRKSAPQGPEYNLVLAMLQDAIECFQKYRCASDPNGRELFEDARAWIFSHDRLWPFSFENICGIVRMDPEYVRSGLSRWAERDEVLRRQGKVVPIAPPRRDATLDDAGVTAKAS
jgi:hypothetical protein